MGAHLYASWGISGGCQGVVEVSAADRMTVHSPSSWWHEGRTAEAEPQHLVWLALR